LQQHPPELELPLSLPLLLEVVSEPEELLLEPLSLLLLLVSLSLLLLSLSLLLLQEEEEECLRLLRLRFLAAAFSAARCCFSFSMSLLSFRTSSGSMKRCLTCKV
jgi:hypothetical protein